MYLKDQLILEWYCDRKNTHNKNNKTTQSIEQNKSDSVMQYLFGSIIQSLSHLQLYLVADPVVQGPLAGEFESQDGCFLCPLLLFPHVSHIVSLVLALRTPPRLVLTFFKKVDECHDHAIIGRDFPSLILQSLNRTQREYCLSHSITLWSLP